MKINNLLISGALKPEASRPSPGSVSIYVLQSSLPARRRGEARPALRALLEVCWSLLVIPDFFIDLLLKPASREPAEGSYDFFFFFFKVLLLPQGSEG